MAVRISFAEGSCLGGTVSNCKLTSLLRLLLCCDKRLLSRIFSSASFCDNRLVLRTAGVNTSSSGITASQSAIGRRASGGGGGTLAAAATGQSDLQHHNQLELDDFRTRQPMEVLELGE